jgi:hypothetical protein
VTASIAQPGKIGKYLVLQLNIVVIEVVKGAK